MKTRHKKLKPTQAGKHVVLIGLGNIGSALAEMLVRTEAVQRLTLVDQGSYEASNLLGQNIRMSDVGKPKAFVQAERAREIRPALQVEAIHAALEDVPMGKLRADVLLTGLDSKRSRQQVNQRVWRLGTPWIDSGVLADGRFARMTVYQPSADAPCLECAWDEKDYQTLEVKRPCQTGGDVAPTEAPAFLGSLAAALQMAECEKILRGDWAKVATGKQITIAAAAHKLYETTLRRNPNCRFDHKTCGIKPLRCSVRAASLGQLIGALKKSSAERPVCFHVEGRSFERRLRCVCGEEKQVFCLEGRMSDALRACPGCGKPMAGVGFWMLPQVSEDALQKEDRARSLTDLGLQASDVITLRNGAAVRAFELAHV